MLGKLKKYKSFRKCENAALLAIKEEDQESFTRIILRSPRRTPSSLGFSYAAKFNWHETVKENLLLSIKTSRDPNPKSDTPNQHPMFRDYVTKYTGCGFTSSLTSKTSLEELALMKATIDGFVQVVEPLIEYIGPHFCDAMTGPFFDYVYMNEDEESRQACLEIILPRLDMSNMYLFTAAEHGGPPHSERFQSDQLKGKKNISYYLAVRGAIQTATMMWPNGLSLNQT